MRDFKGMKRQRGRNRNGGGGGKPQQHNANRAFDSNGPEGIKVRGNAQHVFEKYQQLARDAQTSGDRVLAENYLQHAEHYFRVIRAVTPNRSPADILGRDAVQGGYDIDFEDESGAQAYAEAQEAEAQAGGEGQDNGQQQRRDDRGFNRDRDQNRYENRQRDDRGPREERGPREDRGPRQDREDRPRFRDRDRDRDRNREDRTPNPAADPLEVVEPQATPLPTSEPALRSGDGDISPAPNFLAGGGPRKVASLTPDAGEEAPKPRRRRAPKSFEGGEPAAPATADEG